MQPTSELYKAILQNPNHAKEIKLNIAGVEYGMGDIVSCSTYGGIFSQPGIGNCTARQIKLEIFPLEEIPRQAKIQIFVRLTLGEQISEWIPKGVFFISTRAKNKLTGALTITGYDAMLKAEQTWLTADYATAIWPMSQSDAVADIAARIGVDVDGRTVLSSDYPVGYPTGENGDLTMREVLGYIAVSNAGNWVITDDGKLRLIGYADTASEDDEESTDKTKLGNNVSSLDCGEKVARISRINLIVDSENMYTVGDDTGRTLEATCSWGTQAMANSILVKVRGVDYHPYTAEDALLDPAAEIGDGVSIADIYSVIATSGITLDKMCVADISAPYTDEIDDEYPYKPLEQRRVERKIAQTKSEITKTAEKINLKIEATDGRVSKVEQDVDSIVLRVTDASGVISEIKLMEAGKIDLTGYATFRGLAEGTTVIDGGCIKAGSKIESPVIVGGTIYAGTPDNMLGFLKMVNDGLEVYDKNGVIKFRIGYTSSDTDYPYIQLGYGGYGNAIGLIKKFTDGVYIGTGDAAKYASGNFSPHAGYSGIFVNTIECKTYVVDGGNMKNIYTGDAIARFG